MNPSKSDDKNDLSLAAFLKHLRRRTFKADIVFLFCTVIMATVLTISIFSYHRNSAAALTMTQRLVEKLTDGMIRHTTGYMKPVQAIVEMTAQIAADQHEKIFPGASLEQFLMKTLQVMPQIDFIYFGNEQGEFMQARWPIKTEPMITRFIRKSGSNYSEIIRRFDKTGTLQRTESLPPPSFDPRSRPWYRGCRGEAAPFWTDLYIFSSTGKPGITASCRVTDAKGRFLGAVGADITLAGLSVFLKENRISPNGVSFIMNTNRRFVAFPDPERMLKVEKGEITPIQAVDLGEPWVTEAVRIFEDTAKRTFTYSNGGNNYLATFTPFPVDFGKDWTIAVLLPEDDFLGPVKQAFRESLMISGVVLLLAVFIGYLFARSLSRPLEILSREVGKVQSFDLEGQAVVSSYIKEIRMMSDAVASMKSGLKAFRRYVPADLVRQMLEAGTEAEPGGKEIEITLFFSDVEGFTSISEQIPARDLMLSLSEYLDVMSREIGRQKGTVDKYIGDAVMALWGAPLPDEEHALGSCRAAVRCQRALDAMNSKWKAEGKPPFRTRIGIHTGFTIVGNVGSRERLNYTALGDNVNLASRLEGVNKLYGTKILISQSTYRYVRNHFIFRPLDIIAVKGKLSSVMIYELLGDADSENADNLDYLAKGFAQVFDAYRVRKWKEALCILEDLHERFPEDIPVSIYQQRCRTCLKQEPPADWNGIIRLDAK